MSRRHPYQRIAFLTIVAACWVLGLFGLDRSRMSSFQLPIVVGAGLIGYWVVVAVRRRVDAGRDDDGPEIHEPQTCVVVRRLGEMREREASAQRILERAPENPAPVDPAPVEVIPVEPESVRRAEPVAIARPARRKKSPKLDYIPLSS